MATCPQCSTELPPGSKFCFHCGHALTEWIATCPACGAGIAGDDSEYCAVCGASLRTCCPFCGNPLAAEDAQYCVGCGATVDPDSWLAGVFRLHLQRRDWRDCSVVPYIDRWGVARASATFAHLAENERPLAFIDGTTHMLGDQGLMLTNRGIHFDDRDHGSQFVPYADIVDIQECLENTEISTPRARLSVYHCCGDQQYEIVAAIGTVRVCQQRPGGRPSIHQVRPELYHKLSVADVAAELRSAAEHLGERLRVPTHGTWNRPMSPTWLALAETVNPIEQIVGYVDDSSSSALGLMFTDAGIHFTRKFGRDHRRPWFLRYVDVVAENTEEVSGELRHALGKFANPLSETERAALVSVLQRLAERSVAMNPIRVPLRRRGVAASFRDIYEFSCAHCGYSAKVQGGPSMGGIVLQYAHTISCKECGRLHDIVVPGPRDPPEEPRCPRSPDHRVEFWRSPGPCPRCGHDMGEGTLAGIIIG